MDRLALLVIGLVLGGGVGFVTAAGFGVTLDGHDHSAPGGHAAMAQMAHEDDSALDISAGPSAPTVALELARDPVSGWNLHLVTGNFRFAPEKAGAAPVAGEGHAHLYVNGRKVSRLYGSWTHIAELPPRAELRVTLNANDHRPLAVAGAPVAAVATAP
ncbi:hypothetical protein G5B40_06180 [Pikeienuella piscinae]|uniref:Uncharacterized protein n=1 Tax=Pikeienuella piscinae TaxID=2748098 RepID=A0A7L5BW60_9RHOB|nr:hypothetical protein [Pikeienuella piscinae]QIE55078.1 hypothetical protein G5B40_06180 [Pikeienuella piscinae]